MKTALRNLQKNKLISFLNILGLATALAVVVLIFNYSYFEFETDKYHQNLDDIYVVKNKDKTHVPYEMAPLIREQISGVKYVSLVESNFKNDFVLQYKNEESIKTEIIFAGEDIINIFSFEVLSGNLQNALSIPQSIVLTESESKRLFGDDNPIGKTLMLKGNNDYLGKSDVEVKAVIKDLPKNSNLQFKSMVSFNTAKKMMFWIDQCIWSCSNVQNYVLLEEGQDPQLLAAQMSETLRSHIPDKVDSNFSLLPYSEVYFSSIRDGFKHGSVKLIYTLGFVALLILIIATINYINLSIAGSAKRRSEIGIRKLVGVRPFQLVSQLLSESVLISLIAMVTGVLMAWLITPYINSLSIIHLPVLKLSSISLWIILIGGSVLIGLMAGMLPALSFNKFKAIALLSKRIGNQAGGINLRRGLIVFQFITSIILIICTITVTRQLYLVKNTDMGFDVNNIINIKLSPEVNMPIFKDKLAQNSGIEAVSFSRWYPGNIGENWGMPLVVDGIEKEVSFACENADANYIDLMGLEMVQGRKFSDELKSDIGSAIINEAAVEAFELENPMEAVFQKRGVTRKIVGVVKDFNFQSLHNKIEPLVIFCEDKKVFSVNVKLVPGNFNRISKTIGEIKTAWNEVSPGFPFEFKFIDQQVEELYKSEMIFEKIFRFGSFFAILISCLGLFGLVLGSTEQRRKEIGIRKVNGAKIGEVLLMLNKDFIKWVLISFVIASPLAWFIMNKWLENFAYKTTLSWWIFALAGVLALGIALLTVSWQSWRAATRNPVEALRYE